VNDPPDDPFESFDPSSFDPENLDIEALMRGLQDAGIDLSRVFEQVQSSGPVNWDIARQIAEQLAAADPQTGEPLDDPAVDATRAAALLDVVRAAQTSVVASTGLSEAGALETRIVTRREWTTITIEGLKPVLESLATTLGAAFTADEMPGAPALGGVPADVLMQVMMSTALGSAAGSLAGLLSHHALGQFDLPLPLVGEPKLALVPSNIDRFAHEWSLTDADLLFALALREVVRAAQHSVRWVRERLVRLSTDYVTGYELDADRLAGQFPQLESIEEVDLARVFEQGDLSQIPQIEIDPEAFLAGLRSPRQEPVLAELQRFGSVLAGYADTIIATVGSAYLTDASRVDEALRRHRVERGRAADFVDSMLGLELGREHYERGDAFCRGVIERAGLPGLNRLWEREEHVPTEAELDAPGLWLARLDLELE
jgi:putative hydrolase